MRGFIICIQIDPEISLLRIYSKEIIMDVSSDLIARINLKFITGKKKYPKTQTEKSLCLQCTNVGESVNKTRPIQRMKFRVAFNTML